MTVCIIFLSIYIDSEREKERKTQIKGNIWIDRERGEREKRKKETYMKNIKRKI